MRKLLLLLTLTVGLGCSSHSEKEGEAVKIGGQLFVVHYQKHHVVSSERIHPVSVHDQMNIRYKVKLENGAEFSSQHDYNAGDEVTFKIYELSR